MAARMVSAISTHLRGIPFICLFHSVSFCMMVLYLVHPLLVLSLIHISMRLRDRDYTDPIVGMPNYFSLLKSYGVVPLPGVVVAGEEDVGSYYGCLLYTSRCV